MRSHTVPKYIPAREEVLEGGEVGRGTFEARSFWVPAAPAALEAELPVQPGVLDMELVLSL